MNEGDIVALLDAARRAALHRAAAALLRSLAGQGARGARHRPPVHVRHDHLDAAGSRIRRDGQQALHPDGHRQDRQPFPHASTSTSYVEYGFTAALEDELDAVSRGEEDWTDAAHEILEALRQLVEKIEKNVSREAGRAGARDRQGPGERQADDACAWAATDRSCRSAPRTTTRSRGSPACAPGRRWTSITLEQALELFKLPRTLGETAEGETIITNIGRFGPYIKYGDKYVLAQGRRSVHRRVAARARGDPPEEGSGREPHHRDVPEAAASRC